MQPNKTNKIESDINRLHLSKQVLIVLVLLFVALIVWTFATIATSQNKNTISPDLIRLSQPLNPTLDRDILAELTQKEYYSEEDITSFPIYKISKKQEGSEETVTTIDAIIETPSPTPRASSASATPTPEPSPTPEALPSPSTEPTI